MVKNIEKMKKVKLTICGTVVNMSDENGVLGSFHYEDWMDNAFPFNEWIDELEALKALGFQIN